METASPVPAAVALFAHRFAPERSFPRTIHLRQRAEMRFSPGGRWLPLAADQAISVGAPAFVWLARVRMAPLVPVSVIDAYVEGEGMLEARLFGCIRLARQAGPALAKGELMRYLAELPWAAPAMLCNPHLQWRETDRATVEVSANSAGGLARVRLRFAKGDVVAVRADDRPRTVGSVLVPTPWEGRFLDYGDLNGWRIPTHAEVSWILPDGPFVCWRGAVTEFRAD